MSAMNGHALRSFLIASALVLVVGLLFWLGSRQSVDPQFDSAGPAVDHRDCLGGAQARELRDELRALGERIDALARRLEEREAALERASTGDAEPSAHLAAGRDEEIAALQAAIARLDGEMAELQLGSVATPPFVELPATALAPSFVRPPGTNSPGRGNNPEASNWSGEQAVGPPDTLEAGDHPTAWASRQADGGEEWLTARFEPGLVPSEILIVESYNPGAVAAVEAVDLDGRSYMIWEGTDPTSEAPATFRIPWNDAFEIESLSILIDSARVQGWNEIDAIGVVANGVEYWAQSVEASSSYSEVYAQNPQPNGR